MSNKVLLLILKFLVIQQACIKFNDLFYVQNIFKNVILYMYRGVGSCSELGVLYQIYRGAIGNP